MDRFSFLIAVAALGAGAASAETWNGTLVDVMCHAKDVSGHTRTCALSARCSGSGFGLVLKDDTFLKFDAAGSQKALDVLKASQKESDLKAKVTGTRKGDVVSVDSVELE